MATFVTIRIPNARRLADVYNRIAVYRATEYDGVYAEITTSSTRIVLTADEITYLYYDGTGLETSYYRWALFSTLSSATSGQSDQFAGELDIAVPILTPDELRKFYLFGIPLDDGNGNLMDDDTLEFYIDAATTYVEKAVDIIIRRTLFAGEHPGPADSHDYYKQDYERYMWLQLLHVPVISVEEVRLVLPSTTQSTTYTGDTIHLDEVAGVVRLVPASGQSAVIALGLAATWLPITNGLMNMIPDVFEVDYTAGFRDGLIPADIKQLIGYIAAIDVLSVIGDILFGPGVAGSDVGLDVLMTRLKTSRSDKSSIFGARINQYWMRAQDLITQQRLIYKGVRLLAG